MLFIKIVCWSLNNYWYQSAAENRSTYVNNNLNIKHRTDVVANMFTIFHVFQWLAEV